MIKIPASKIESDKFVVFKKEDLDFVLDRYSLLKEIFVATEVLVMLHRIARNKRPHNKYIICNQDEPYADKIWNVLLEGEDEKIHKED